MTTSYRGPDPLAQDERPRSSLPLADADLSLGNANWSKGLQAMSDWIWSGNLNPVAFPNNLGRYFLQIPGIFEQQLNFSTTMIFDEPSFRNGVQISGFLNRVVRELVISLIAQRRRCWYSMTHHAILGRFTAQKHGVSEDEYISKWAYLTEHEKYPQHYTPVEREALVFADAFCTNPKAYTDEQFSVLKAALQEDNEKRYAEEHLWLARLQAARVERARILLKGKPDDEAMIEACRSAAEDVEKDIPSDLNERKFNAQMVELGFLCLQFVALSCAFTGLNIPDEDFLADVMKQVVPAPVIEKINELNRFGLEGRTPELVPPSACEDPDDLNVGGAVFEAVKAGRVKVSPALLKGARIPLTPYEGRDKEGNFRPAFAGLPDIDAGLTVGGIQVGVYGWSFGGHFPGSLPYCLMNHPELSRYEAPYSLPLLFNEDEWRNGIQTGGYTSRRLKELVIQKVYRTNRCRYGLEHHTMFFYNTFFDEHGLGLRAPMANFSQKDGEQARAMAAQRAHNACLHVHDHTHAPPETFSPLEEATLTWVQALLQTPHRAHLEEKGFREELEQENMMEIRAGTRRLDTSPGIGEKAALKRLVDHQVAELSMMTGHMDGLGRAMTMLRLEAEEAVMMVVGEAGPSGGIIPDCDDDDQVQFTGYFNNRPGVHDVLPFIGVSEEVLTLNELMVNPPLCKAVAERLQKGEKNIQISSKEAEETAEF
jgi:alkylhydroperoxidase family enzyme